MGGETLVYWGERSVSYDDLIICYTSLCQSNMATDRRITGALSIDKTAKLVPDMFSPTNIAINILCFTVVTHFCSYYCMFFRVSKDMFDRMGNSTGLNIGSVSVP